MLLALDEDQRERGLEHLMRGTKTGCFALTGPGAGSEVRGMSTRAQRDGDEYVLDGQKHLVSNGPYTDFVEVFAKTDPGSRSPHAISPFIVARDTPGMEFSDPQDTIARDGLQCEITFDDCRVPAANRVGAEGEGFFLATQLRDGLRLQIGGQAAGLAEYRLDKAVGYANQREAFEQPVADFQAVSHPLAEARKNASGPRPWPCTRPGRWTRARTRRWRPAW
jgi:alkylation response protein AidB-like acyl-CoA dehydrogenase